MAQSIQIRDLITKLQLCGDDSQSITVFTDEGEGSQELVIHEVHKVGSREWAILVSPPELDEEALEEKHEAGFKAGYKQAKADAVVAINNNLDHGKIPTRDAIEIIESLKHET